MIRLTSYRKDRKCGQKFERFYEVKMSKEIKTQVVVLGAGPAGYSAAFRCADLGLETVLVERYSTLGGVCLNVGCIPSKALLHVAKVIEEAKHASKNGVYFAEPRIDLDEVRAGKEAVVAKLTGGLAGMAKQRKVTVVEGLAAFTDPHTLVARDRDGKPTTIKFDNAIIAAGSRPIQLPFIPHEDPRVWDSTDALKLKEVPKKLLIMGGGIIGLEMGTVYDALGSEVEVVEMFDQVIPAADKDVVGIYTKQVEKKFKLMLETKVTAVEAKDDGIYVTGNHQINGKTHQFQTNGKWVAELPGTPAFEKGKYTKVIFLDPGHGGRDSGAFYYNIAEKDLNMQIYKKLRKELEGLGYTVLTSRESDVYVDFVTERSKMVNKTNADMFISIHFNATSNSASNVSGIQTYSYEQNPDYPSRINSKWHNHPDRISESKRLASSIHSSLLAQTGAKNAGLKESSFAVLRETNKPAVLLELGYMSNFNENQLIRSDAYQNKLVTGIVKGIQQYYAGK